MAGGQASTGKSPTAPDALSERDKAVCDGFLAGQSRKQLADQQKLTVRRIGQILHQPAAVAYLAVQAGNTKALVFAKVGAEILARLDWGGVKLTDLIAIWKAAMPQEMTLTVQPADIEAAAERLAQRTGVPKERAIVDIRERLNRKAG